MGSINEVQTVEALGENTARTEEGYLVCANVKISSTFPMSYLIDDKEVLVTKPSNELFSIETIESFEAKPITVEHPENLTFVDTTNWKELSVGFLRNVKQEGEYLVSDLIITDETAISAVLEGGVRQVSIGFTSVVVAEGDSTMQTSIRGNHLAIVKEGRAGDKCSIIDKKGASMDAKKPTESETESSYQRGFIDAVKHFFTSKPEATKAVDVLPEVEAEVVEAVVEAVEATEETVNQRLDKIEAQLNMLLELLTPKEPQEEVQEEAPVADTKHADSTQYLPKTVGASAQAQSLASYLKNLKEKGN